MSGVSPLFYIPCYILQMDANGIVILYATNDVLYPLLYVCMFVTHGIGYDMIYSMNKYEQIHTLHTTVVTGAEK